MSSHSAVNLDEDILDQLVKDTGCTKQYFQLEECMALHSRDWTKCQDCLKAWKSCVKLNKAKYINGKHSSS